MVFIGLAMIAITGFMTLSHTWVKTTVDPIGSTAQLEAGPIKIYWDCDKTNPVIDIDWGPVTEGQTYGKSVFVMNEGIEMLWVTYLPTWVQDIQYKLLPRI